MREQGVNAEAARALTAEELETARMVLWQMEPQHGNTAHTPPGQLLRRLSAALSNQVFNVAFSGNLRVLEGILSLPARLLAATGVHAGMRQPGWLVQKYTY